MALSTGDRVSRERREIVAKVLFIAGMVFAAVTTVWILRMAVTVLGGLD